MTNETNMTVAQYIAELNNALDSRVAFEESKNVKDNIFTTLSKLRKNLTRESIAQVFLSHNVDANFVNRALRADSRMNVYAIAKAENIASAIAKSERVNHFTRAILLTVQNMNKHDVLMTRKDAESACHADSRLKDSKREKLLVKTQTHVSASTAASQYSSSLDALCIFNVLERTHDKENNEAYKLRDNDAAKALLERCA